MSTSLLRAFGALTLRPMARPALSLAPRTAPAVAMALRGDGSIAGGVMEQVRGMKVHSSVKKRCEHCKVRYLRPLGGHSAFVLGADWMIGEWLADGLLG